MKDQLQSSMRGDCECYNDAADDDDTAVYKINGIIQSWFFVLLVCGDCLLNDGGKDDDDDDDDGVVALAKTVPPPPPPQWSLVQKVTKKGSYVQNTSFSFDAPFRVEWK